MSGLNKTDRELLQQALDALEAWDARGRLRIMEAIRTRLAQPNKEWVGLTDEEIYFEMPYKDTLFEFAKAIEAKLKDKNT
jgi:SpoVK/Ycf46/Vps4 family AAA+-type ATPase